MVNSNTVNELSRYIKEDVIRLANQRNNEIESVSFGTDKGCGFKNDIYVSFHCTDVEHCGQSCMCSEILDQDKVKDIEIDLKTAENIAHYVSGLLGGRRVYQD
ncbi:hypothetical protein MZM54_00910 [[Brevibacterium] frigoritolerans]|nr:hypothetical protein [Peribacillus frigoritolerans]